MPAPLAVDKEQVRMLVLAVGVREAARQMDIPEGTVQYWSASGKWLAPTKPQPALLPPPASQIARSTASTSPADALRNTLEEDSQACKTHALRYAKRTLKHAADLAETAPDVALTQAPNVASATKVAAQAGSWDAITSLTHVNVNIQG